MGDPKSSSRQRYSLAHRLTHTLRDDRLALPDTDHSLAALYTGSRTLDGRK